MKLRSFCFFTVIILLPALVLAAPANVPQTGQTKCYDASGNEISCSGTGQDGDIQAGVPLPTPRFTDNGDGTVTDNLTGLIWLKNANCINTNYPGFDTDDTAGDGQVTWQHALDFVAGINAGIYSQCGAGQNDWRLPNIRELRSLVHKAYYNPALSNADGTDKWSEGDPFTGVQYYLYWSGTTDAYDSGYAWLVTLWNGCACWFDKYNAYYVWPVRGGQ